MAVGDIGAWWLVAPLAAVLAYFTVGWGPLHQTLGMHLLGIHIERAHDSNDPNLGQRLARSALGVAPALGVFVVALVSFSDQPTDGNDGNVAIRVVAGTVFAVGFVMNLTMLLRRDRRAFHDLVTGLVVVQDNDSSRDAESQPKSGLQS